MTKTNRGGKVLIADIEGDNYLCWHLDHPNGNTYDVIFHTNDKTWSVDLGRYDEEVDDWKFTPLMVHSDRAPHTLFKDCGVAKLVGMRKETISEHS